MNVGDGGEDEGGRRRECATAKEEDQREREIPGVEEAAAVGRWRRNQPPCNEVTPHRRRPEILKPSSPSPSAPAPPSSSPLPPSLFLKPCEESPNPRAETTSTETAVAASTTPKTDKESKPEEESRPQVRFNNGCSTCGRKVGLTGFRCRCGDLFCGRHRYSDTHDCSFDYKALGREEIAKANPVVKAAKIIKI
ncbi:hypothetical protein BHM03_00011939 [Ensete ventricosum]|nr:hypothetical protein BHM03_00011939 [Ensete ventricosum]